MKNSGFTLLELLIVITIIAILSGAIVPLFKSNRQEAQIAKAKTDLEVIRSASNSLYIGTGYWPPQIYCGCGFVRDPEPGNAGGPIPGWKGPYLNDWVFDPWGHFYELYINGSALLVRSCGPDGKRVTGDDIILAITPKRSSGLDNGCPFTYGADGSDCYSEIQ